jgi:hypothetical protein
MVRRAPYTPEVAFLAELEWEATQEAERERERIARLTEDQRTQEQARQQSTVWRIYKDDPVAWVHDMIDWRDGEGPAGYQDEIMAAVPVHKRVSFRGPHTMGKTAMMAWVTLWYALTRDGEDWKIPTTASAWRQLTKYLWPEIRKWARRLRWDKIGRDPFDRRTELLMHSLKLRTGEAFAMASDTPENMEGAHADRLLALFDESKTIPAETFDALEGALSGQGEAFAMAGSTPGEPVGRFYEIHRRAPGTEDWYVRHVTMEEAIVAGRMSREWAEQRAKQWGTGSAVYQNRVLGEFAASDEDSVIPLAWVEAAQDRWREIMDDPEYIWPPFTALGVDVGSGSDRADKTTFALRQMHIISEIRRFQRADTMETAGRIKGILDAHGGRAMIDAIGIGAGTLHRLREEKVRNVYAFIAGASPKQPTGEDWRDRSGELGAADTRSAAWWHLRELLDPTYGENIALPPDDTLTGDLTAPKYRVQGTGKIKVESKDELRKPERLGRSTDDGDSVIQAFWEPADREVEIPTPTGIPRSDEPWMR